MRERGRDRAVVRAWLALVALMIVAMVVVGGATRLTHSGLSITEWQPIHGVIPPLNDAEWQDEFAKYQQIPEYQQINRGMTLAEFKGIFWWEWAHRLLGRAIGAVVLIPLIGFWITGRVEPALKPKLVAIFLLGGLQGAVGWWMVSSGLSERTDVSQYRLATHLTLAAAILAYVVWVIRGLAPSPLSGARRRLRRRGGIDRRAGRRADLPRRTGRRARRRPDLQHLAADGRLTGAVRAFRPVAVVAESVRERPRPCSSTTGSAPTCCSPLRWAHAFQAQRTPYARPALGPGAAGDVAGDARHRDAAGDRAAAVGAAAPARRRDRADRGGHPFPRHVAGDAAGGDGANR